MNASTAIVPLKTLKLPVDYAWRTGMVASIENYLQENFPNYRVKIPRFIGYFFINNQPFAQSGEMKVALRLAHPINVLNSQISEDPAVNGLFSVASKDDVNPLFMLIHDRYDGSCHLMSYAAAEVFLTSVSSFTPATEKRSQW